MKIRKLDEMVKDSFGLSLSALFSSVGGNYPELNFYQHKEIFFAAVEKLLEEGRILFVAPGGAIAMFPRIIQILIFQSKTLRPIGMIAREK